MIKFLATPIDSDAPKYLFAELTAHTIIVCNSMPAFNFIAPGLWELCNRGDVEHWSWDADEETIDGTDIEISTHHHDYVFINADGSLSQRISLLSLDTHDYDEFIELLDVIRSATSIRDIFIFNYDFRTNDVDAPIPLSAYASSKADWEAGFDKIIYNMIVGRYHIDVSLDNTSATEWLTKNNRNINLENEDHNCL